jgi:hypothetical protein
MNRQLITYKSGLGVQKNPATSIPWIQIELSRGDIMTLYEKRDAVISALSKWAP